MMKYCAKLLVFMMLLIVATEARSDSLTKVPNHVYICTFNVYKLGSVADKYLALEEESDVPSGGIPMRINNLANVLAVGQFDLIVLQEVTDGVRGEWAVADLVRDLKERHGLNYRHFPSGGIGRGLMEEAIAFIYDPSVVEPQVLTGTTTMVSNIEIDGRDLVRTQWTAGSFDFTLVACHLAWGNEDDRDDGYNMVEEILSTPVPSQFSHDPDIIVLGDFNRFGAGYDSVKELAFDPAKFLAPNVTFFDPGFNDRKSVTISSLPDNVVPNDDPQLISTTVAQNTKVYDMILFTIDAAEEFAAGTQRATYGVDFGIIHFDESNGFGFQTGADHLTHNELKEAYSDHRPLWMRFRTDAAHADHTPAGPGTHGVTSTYVGTENGRRFHFQSCRTIRGRNASKHWESRGEGLADRSPCGVCRP